MISDHHLGLKAGIESTFVGSAWQRCRVNFMRNVLARVPKAPVEMVAAAIRTVFAQPDAAHVRAQLDEVQAMLAAQFPDVAALLGDAAKDLLAFIAFPQVHWRKIWSTNPLVRLNGEIKRRTNVVGIFPTTPPARLITAVVVETHDEWAVAERRYLSEASMAKLYAVDTTDPEEPLLDHHRLSHTDSQRRGPDRRRPTPLHGTPTAARLPYPLINQSWARLLRNLALHPRPKSEVRSWGLDLYGSLPDLYRTGRYGGVRPGTGWTGKTRKPWSEGI